MLSFQNKKFVIAELRTLISRINLKHYLEIGSKIHSSFFIRFSIKKYFYIFVKSSWRFRFSKNYRKFCRFQGGDDLKDFRCRSDFT